MKKNLFVGLVVLTILCLFIYLLMFVGIGKFKNIIGKAVESKCNEDWICGEWSECEDGEQVRACIDVNKCETELKKPDEVMGCSLADGVVKSGMSIRWYYRFEETLGISIAGVTLLIALVSVFSSLAFTLITKEISNRELEREKNKPQIEDVSLVRLANYVQRELNCGYTKNQIKEKLLLEGWNVKSIDGAFARVEEPKKDKEILLENKWKMDLSKKIDDAFKSYKR